MKSKVLVLVLAFIPGLLFSAEIPFLIKNFYHDWNLLALHTDNELQNKYWKIFNDEKIDEIDLEALPLEEALIVKSLLNVYVNYPNKISVCPIRDLVIMVDAARNYGDSITLDISEYKTGGTSVPKTKKIEQWDFAIDGLKLMGKSRHVWKTENGRYELNTSAIRLTQ